MYYIFVSALRRSLEPIFDMKKENVAWCVPKGREIKSEFHYKIRGNTRIIDCYSFYPELRPNSVKISEKGIHIWHGYLLDEVPLRNMTAMDPAQNYYGVYSHGKITDQDCWFATDELGLSPLYYSKEDDVLFISNNPHLIAIYKYRLGMELSVDPTLAIWQTIGITNESNHTGYEGVYRLLPWRYIYLDWSNQIVFPCKKRSDSASSYEEMCQKSIQELRKGIKTIASQYKDLRAQLTGGFDSRLVLSFILDSKEQDRFTFETGGFPENPDCIVASMLAEKYGLKHVCRPRGVSCNADVELDSFVKEICMANAMESSLVRLQRFQGLENGSVTLNGFGAVFAKSLGFAKGFQIYMNRKFRGKEKVDFSNLTSGQQRQGYDCFGYADADRYFLTNEAINVSNEFRKYLFQFNYDRFPENMNYADSMSAYRWRIHNSSLATMENNCIFLYSPTVLEASRKLTPELRQNAKLYFDMMWQLRPDICFVPFENRVVDPGVYETFPVEIKEIFSRILPITGSIVSEYQITYFDLLLPSIRKDLIDMLPVEVFDFVKRDALEARLKEEDLTFERKNFPLMSLYGVAKWYQILRDYNNIASKKN